MRIRIITGVFLLFALLVSSRVSAQTVVRGVNLGQIGPSDVNALGAWKANVARFNLWWGYNADNADNATYQAWIDSEMIRLDALLPSLAENKIKVVVNLITPPGGYSIREGQPQYRTFAEKWAQDALVETWVKLATHYKGNKNIWGFDILNEPATRQRPKNLKDWNALALILAKRIRSIDPSRTIIVESEYGVTKHFARLKKLPLQNIVYSTHAYQPWGFVHQGLYGVPLNISYPDTKWNKKALQKVFQPVVDFQKKNKVPIYVGEFSVVRWAPGKSGYNYLKDMITIFEANKWSWTYHAFREADCWSLEHGSDPNNNEPALATTDRLRLLLSYFKKNK